MKTYNLVEKNGSAVITIDGENEEEIMMWFREKKLNENEWRLENAN